MDANNNIINTDNVRHLTERTIEQPQTNSTGNVSVSSGGNITIRQGDGGTVRNQPPMNLGNANTGIAQQDLGVQIGTQANQPVAQNLQVNQPPAFRHETTAPAFTFTQLDNLTKGTYNVGELRLTRSGALEKINNHVWVKSGENTVRLTPRQNFEVRDKVCQCLERRFQGNPMIETVRSLLIGADFRTHSLSRDEIRFLITMLENARDGKSADGYTSENFLRLHEYKMGNREHADEIERKFVKGVRTANDKNDAKALGIAKAVSSNASQSIVSSFLAKIRNSVLALFNGSPKADFDAVQDHVKDHFCSPSLHTNSIEPKKRIFLPATALGTIAENVEQALSASDDVHTSGDRPAADDFWQNCQYAVGKEFIRQLDNHHVCHTLLAFNFENISQQPNILLTNLRPNSNQKTNTDVYLRQTPGSNICFFNCVVDGMLYAAGKLKNDAYAHKLQELFSPTGCKLRNRQGEEVNFHYENLATWNGKFKLLEQTVINHIDDCNQGVPETQKWNSVSIMTSLRILGLREIADWENPSNWQFGFDSGRSDKDRVLAFLQNLKAPKDQNALFAFVETVVSKNDSHYFTLCPPKEGANLEDNLVYDKSGTNLLGVKVHVISDRADGPDGAYEYDKLLSIDKLMGSSAEGTLDFTAFTLQ